MNTESVNQNLIKLWEEIFTADNITNAGQTLTDVSEDLAEEFEDAAALAKQELRLSEISASELTKFAGEKLVSAVAEILSTDEKSSVLASLRCFEHADTYSESVYVFVTPVSNTLFETYLVLESDESSALNIVQEFIREHNEDLDEEDLEYTFETLNLVGAINPA